MPLPPFEMKSSEIRIDELCVASSLRYDTLNLYCLPGLQRCSNEWF